MFQVIIAGTRTFSDYDLLKEKLNFIFSNIEDEIVIISGTANGADRLGEKYAKENGLKLKMFPANWKEHGKAAGPIRNLQMANVADAAIVFWDGISKGTENMIQTAKAKGLPVCIIKY